MAKVTRLDQGSETWDAPSTLFPNGRLASASIDFYVTDAKHRSDAIAAVMAEAPEEYNGRKLLDIAFGDWAGDGTAIISCNYGTADSAQVESEEEATAPDEPDEPDEDVDSEPQINFNCGAGSITRINAISQQCVWHLVNDIPANYDDAGGMIGWNGKGGAEAEYAGVDVPVSDLQISFTKTMRRKKVMETKYQRNVAFCVGKVNSVQFKGWNAGEVMFLGASFDAGNEKNVTVKFNFKIQPNEANAVVAGINCGFKKGFEYMWVRPWSGIRQNADGSEAEITFQVGAIYKSQVAYYCDFNILGI